MLSFSSKLRLSSRYVISSESASMSFSCCNCFISTTSQEAGETSANRETPKCPLTRAVVFYTAWQCDPALGQNTPPSHKFRPESHPFVFLSTSRFLTRPGLRILVQQCTHFTGVRASTLKQNLLFYPIHRRRVYFDKQSRTFWIDKLLESRYELEAFQGRMHDSPSSC